MSTLLVCLQTKSKPAFVIQATKYVFIIPKTLFYFYFFRI